MKNKKIILMALSALMLAGVTSCGGNQGNSDISFDSSGNIIERPGEDATKVKFWMYGDSTELQVYKELVKEFNRIYEGTIEVVLTPKSSDGYGDALNLTLSGSTAPDIFYVGETGFQHMAEQNMLLDISEYVAKSKDYDITNMWDSAVSRFQYDINTKTHDGPNAKFYAVPKDIGPTVIFYNETMFKNSGVKVLSVDAADLAKFNSGEINDDRGNSKASLGIAGEVKEKGYFEDANGQKWFNNQVPMSWEETVELSNVIQAKYNPDGKSGVYGYFTEWWFNYGWSVGGDCIQYIPTNDSKYSGGVWDFTLMDPTKNFIVDDNAEPFVINGHTYQPGEILSYQDKLIDEEKMLEKLGEKDDRARTVDSKVLAAVETGQLEVLPSQREAFTEFVRLASRKTTLVDNVNGEQLFGYEVTPYPSSIGGDAGKTLSFASGKIAMLVDGRWNVTNFREQMDGKYEWDVAPLPMYKEYDAEGNVTVHGVEAGHSGSVGVAIWSKTKYANAAWKFIEYIGGPVGQSVQSKTGFAIPLQKDLAEDEEIFLQTNQNPRNSEVFIDAAEHQKAGDWWYLKDNEWIDAWAGVLNGDVRNGKKTMSEFFASYEYASTYSKLLKYSEK